MATRHLDGEMPVPGPSTTTAELVGRAVEEIGVPAYMLDRDGRIVWMNQRAKALFGDRVGRPYTEAVTPDTVPIARTAFAKKIEGIQPQTHEAGFLFAADGTRVPVEITAVTTRDDTGGVVGVLGIIAIKNGRSDGAKPTRALTPRQREILRELARGSSTDEIASQLTLSRTTVRNHIANTLAALGAHTRLQAVIRAQQCGLLD